MKSSTIARAFELLKLATKLGVKEFKSSDFKSRFEQAVLIVKSLSHLKGAAMKAGQLLSLDLEQYFPPEAIEILSQLQNAAVAQPFSEIQKTIHNELSSQQIKSITSMDENPIGIASIGQVHKAKYCGQGSLNDQDIVLKVQYANIADSVESDLKILKVLASSFCQITGRKMDLDPLFQEIKFILKQELDYVAEAKFQKEFQEKIQNLNALDVAVQYRVPKIINELCSKKILAMSFETGLTLRQWINTNPSNEKKQAIAVAVLDLYFYEFFQWGLVQTDPNWGNFLIDEGPSKLHLCILDFGATRIYSKEFITDYTNLLILVSENKKDEIKKHSIKMGLIDARENTSAFDAFENMLKIAIKPFLSGKSGASYFDFGDQNHALEANNAVKILSSLLVYSPPPYSIIFLHRKLAGVYSILKNFKVTIDVSPYWQMMKKISDRSNQVQ